YTVKKGTSSTVTVTKVVLNADKTSASLTVNSSYLAETDYTVVVGATSLSFKGVAEKVTKIEIVGDKLVVTDVSGDSPSITTAAIEYYVLNQFGEKMEDTDINVTAAITGMSVDAGATTAAKKGKNGVITLTGKTADLTMGQKGSIVLVDRTNGINVSKVITLSNIATVTSAEYVGLYKDCNDDTNRKLVTSFDDSATAGEYSLLFKVKDQYGNAVKASKLTRDEITVTANGTAGLTATGAFYDVTINDEDYVAYTLAGVPTVGVSTYTFVGNKTGLLANVTVNVTKQVSLASLKISPKETIYNNTPVEVEYTAVDTDGNEVTDYSKLSKLAPVGTTFAVTSNRDTTATGTFAWSQASDGKAVLTYKPSYKDFAGSNNKETTLLPITVKCGTNNVQVYNFTVNYQKEATSIEGVDSTVALAAITKTGKIKLTMADFVIVDQYNNPLSDDEAASLVGAIGVRYSGTSAGFTMTDISTNKASAVSAGT
ncbi:hypothetical protein, partial [Ruminococcus sp.]|uniref:hypothetical protein n=1 Tax=Ruminococcus sp. TaxID=41978 RepID=UPI002E7FC7CC